VSLNEENDNLLNLISLYQFIYTFCSLSPWTITNIKIPTNQTGPKTLILKTLIVIWTKMNKPSS